MDHTDYLYEFEEWLKFAQDRMSVPSDFIGDHPYRHFDSRLSFEMMQTNEALVVSALKYPKDLARHSFLPFIRKDKKVRRYNKDKSTNKTVVKQKLRPIMYASHTDACIYGFYSYLLKQRYEARIRLTSLNESVIAYRRIERIPGTDRGKSNIDFAKDIKDLISKQPECAVLCLDISQFFDSMNHKIIKKRWASLLELEKLPIGHYAVFKNVTKYRYVFLSDTLLRLNYGYFKKGRFLYYKGRKNAGRLCSIKDFRAKIDGKKDSVVHKNKEQKGIPQGSPISDIIANLYLEDFDKSIVEQIETYEFGHYRRYSDDILIICPPAKAKEIYEHAAAVIKSEKLIIKAEKSEIILLNNLDKSIKDITYLITGIAKHALFKREAFQYLGFEIDAKDIHIRSGTIANHYRRALRRARIELEAKKRIPSGRPAVSKSKKGKSNRSRWQYFINSERRTSSDRVKRQYRKVAKRVKSFKLP